MNLDDYGERRRRNGVNAARKVIVAMDALAADLEALVSPSRISGTREAARQSLVELHGWLLQSHYFDDVGDTCRRRKCLPSQRETVDRTASLDDVRAIRDMWSEWADAQERALGEKP